MEYKQLLEKVINESNSGDNLIKSAKRLQNQIEKLAYSSKMKKQQYSPQIVNNLKDAHYKLEHIIASLINANDLIIE